MHREETRMSEIYRHILVALDLAENNQRVLAKGVALAKLHQARLSVIHVDISLKDLYTEMIDIDIEQVQEKVAADTQEKLAQLLTDLDYPVDKTLALCGDLASSVNEVVQSQEVDLLVCGHHQTFWSLLTSSARQLMNSVDCDLLVIPLPEEEEVTTPAA